MIATKIKFIGTVHLTGWSNQKVIQTLFEENRIKLKSGTWFGTSKYGGLQEIRELAAGDLDRDGAWSTYIGCQDIGILYNTSGKLEIHITVYNGDNFTGDIVSERFKAVFIGATIKDIKPFSESIERQFKQAIEYAYENEERIRENKRKKEIEQAILSGKWITSQEP